jgi:acyl-CoA reductase-like NAD-dependent aldehyde dehydrogenase
MAIESVNPATEETIARFDEATPQHVDQAVEAVYTAQRDWRRTSLAERGAAMQRAAAYLRQHKDRFAQLISLEMGKPISQSLAEIEKCAWNCEYYAEAAEGYLADRPVATNAQKSYIAFEPLGVVLAIMPWNFPFWQVIRFAAPGLMAGNTAVLKHASNVPQCALAVEEVFRESGFPENVFRTLLIGSGQVDRLIADKRIAAVTLTGSDLTGAKVAEAAGRNLKKCVLELGGSDPFIVLADADLQATAQQAATARNQNTGQSCIASKRFIVEESVAEDFEHAFAEAVSRMRLGDPLDPEVQVGPMARGDLRDDLIQQVQASIREGARVVTGGSAREGRGYFYQPTILSDVQDDMTVFRQETFGPVAALIRARDAEHAVALANDSDFGLGASIWTRDLDRAQQLARRIESGSVFVNAIVASDPRLPFGGVKRSGYGRELDEFGILEFCNIQTVFVAAPAGTTVEKRAE